MSQKPGGVGFYCDGVNTIEVHSSKCKHCGTFTEFPSRKEMFKYVDVCKVCMELICLRPECRECVPLIKKIERQEEEYYRKKQLAKMLGV